MAEKSLKFNLRRRKRPLSVPGPKRRRWFFFINVDLRIDSHDGMTRGDDTVFLIRNFEK